MNNRLQKDKSLRTVQRNTPTHLRIAAVSRALVLVACGVFCVAAAAQDQPTSSPVSEPSANYNPTFQERNPRYRIHPGDVLELAFSFTPEFNQTLNVEPDGFVNLKDVGDLHIAGETIPELTALLKSRYASILHDPEISIVLKDFDEPHFIVGGEVNRPGKYELRTDTTVMEAIAIAGGLNDRSKHSQVLLLRRVSTDWVEVKKLNLKTMAKSANFAEDVHLRPGDMIFVPQNSLSKVKPFLPFSALSSLAYRF
jgi:protein involved in polysaccharide export with SLBB domain